MAYIESSVSSELHSAPDPDEDQTTDGLGAEDQGEDDEAPARQPKDRAPAGSRKAFLVEQINDLNLARYIDQQQLDTIGMDVVREFEIDQNSRADWVDASKQAMKMATQKTQPKQFPWPGASNVIFPLMTQASLEFASRAYPALVPSRNVVKGVVWGSDTGTPVTMDGSVDGPPKMQPAQPGQPPQPVWLVAPGEKRKRADRISEHMSWQLMHEMPEWEPQTDQMTHQAPVTGGMIRKSYYDPIIGRSRSLTVSLMNLVWNYHAPSFEDAPRHTEIQLYYPNEIVEMERHGAETEDDDGMFLRYSYAGGGGADGLTFNYDDKVQSSDQSDPDAPHFFLEQHRRLDLDDDGYAEPYIVTVHLRSAKVVRIVAMYDEEGIQASEDGDLIQKVEIDRQYTLYPFLPNIEGGSYPMGFGHYLRSLNRSVNTAINQMFDAGTLQNAGGGFISNQLGAPSGQTLFQVGKFVRVDNKGGDIRQSVLPIDFQGPSSTLFQLLGVLITASKEIAAINNVLTGDAAIANAPPTTILALIEQGMKVYTAIYKRFWRSMKSELAKLYKLNRRYIKEAQKYNVGDEFREITPEDYRLGGGVEPVADPTMTTDMQRLGRAQIVMSVADDPLVNRKEALTRLFEAADLERIDDLFTPPDPTAAQMAMATAQAELGKTRSEELKNQTQAFLNMALARKNATAQEETFIEQQLGYLRLSIEAINSQVKAQTVAHKFHDTAMDVADSEAQRAHERAMAAAEMAQGAGQPTAGPEGAFPEAPVAPPGPAVNKPAPGGMPPPDESAPPAAVQQSQPLGEQ